MKKIDVGTIEIVENAKENALTLEALIHDIDQEGIDYEEYNDGELYADFFNSKIQVHLTDANGKLIVGNVKLVVGFCGENTILSGEVTDVYK